MKKLLRYKPISNEHLRELDAITLLLDDALISSDIYTILDVLKNANSKLSSLLLDMTLEKDTNV